MVSIGTWKKEFFQYGENLNVQFLAFNDFLNSFFLDLLMNQVNHYQICFLFFNFHVKDSVSLLVFYFLS